MEKINNYIEHTLLSPCATNDDIKKLCDEAVKYEFLGVCVNPNYIELTKNYLENTSVKIVTVVNFPLASNTIQTTCYQTENALKLGASEIDTVLNISAIKNKDYKKAVYDIQKVKEICSNVNLKVIIETDLLTKDEIIEASKCVIEAGANFVKTSTGFVKNGVGAKVEDVEAIYNVVKPFGLGIKASGGIKDYKKACDLIKAGATRLGTSSGVEIVKGEG